MKTQRSKIYGCSKSSSKREVYRDKSPPQKTGKIPINNLNLHLKKLEKEKKKTKPKVSRRKEIIKIRAEINKTVTEGEKKKRSMKLRAGSLKR